jgi:hypothetical protein
MPDNKFLTAEEVSQRYRGEITVGTLRNWRAMRIGPAFVKIRKAVLYPVTELDAWDLKNIITCHPSRSRIANERTGRDEPARGHITVPVALSVNLLSSRYFR